MRAPESSCVEADEAPQATVPIRARLRAVVGALVLGLLAMAGILIATSACFTGQAIDMVVARMPGVPRWLLASAAALAMSAAWMFILTDVQRWHDRCKESNSTPRA